MHLTLWHVVGLLATIALIIGIGIYSGRKVRSAADFASGGGKAGAWIVCGAIMGTLGQRPGHHRHRPAGLLLRHVRLVVHPGAPASAV